MTKQSPTFDNIINDDGKGMFPECFEEGLKASKDGKNISSNPYGKATQNDIWEADKRVSWRNGWYKGLDDV